MTYPLSLEHHAMITAEDIIRLMVMGYWGAMLLLMLIVWLLVWKLVPKGHKWWTGVLGTAAAAALFVSPMFKQNAKAQKKNQKSGGHYNENVQKFIYKSTGNERRESIRHKQYHNCIIY